MKPNELYKLNELAQTIAVLETSSKPLETMVFNLIVEHGEIEIAESNIYFDYHINNGLMVLELTIWNNESKEINIDVSELEGRIDKWTTEKKDNDIQTKFTEGFYPH